MIALFTGDLEDQAAFAALSRGDADGGQQQRALNVIVRQLGTMGLSTFVPDNARQTDFNMGRQWVALSIAGMAGLPVVEMPPLRVRKFEDE